MLPYMLALILGIGAGFAFAVACARWCRAADEETREKNDWVEFTWTLEEAGDGDARGTIELAKYHGLTPWMASLAIIRYWKKRDEHEQETAEGSIDNADRKAA